MKQLKSVSDLDRLVEKHANRFPSHLAEVGNLHPSHGERLTNAQALKPVLLRYQALRMEMTENYPQFSGIWDRTQTSLEDAVNKGDIYAFNRYLQSGLKRLTQNITEHPTEKPDFQYAEAVRQNLFLVMDSAQKVRPVAPTVQELRQPAQQVTIS